MSDIQHQECGAVSPEDGLRENAVCVRPKGHASYHATTTEDVVESATGYFWHDAPSTPALQGEKCAHAPEIPKDLKQLYFYMGLPAETHTEHNMAQDIQRLIERTGRAESTLARERESRKQAEAQAQLHNDAAVEAIQRSQEYMAKYDKLVAEGWDELKKVAGERDKAFNAGIAMAADFANGFGCLMEIVPGETKADHLQRFMGKLVFAIRALTKPVQGPAERERGK